MARAAVIGGGPAGLMAAEVLSAAGVAVTVYDRMPSLARKFLMAGRGGLNLTHSEPLDRFLHRYGEAEGRLRPYIEAFGPQDLVAWAEGLGQPVFTGTSGRIFPKSLKASPLLRAWLRRLTDQGVEVRTRWRWTGWTLEGGLVFEAPEGQRTVEADVTILALGGASWPKLGSDGGWTRPLAGIGAQLTPFRPSNMGVCIPWSEVFLERFEGQPLKNVALAYDGHSARGEASVTGYGLEGGAVYAISAPLRDGVERQGEAMLQIDLRPDMGPSEVASKLARARGGDSVANQLRKTLNLSGLEVNLLREAMGVNLPADPERLAWGIKSAHLKVTAVQPIDRAISTAGGVAFDSVDESLMLRARPGVFVAGEMLGWEAPTGGYLLQASFATGAAAAQGALRRLRRSPG